MKEKFVGQRGQTALIALLVLTIATTVGLSLIARSTTDIAITRSLEESARAFSAAEAGVEKALITGLSVSSPVDVAQGTRYQVTVAPVTGDASSALVFSGKTLSGDTETIWLTDHDGNGTIIDSAPVYTAPTIDVCWSSESVVPAIATTILYKNSSDGSYRVVKGAFDPDSTRASGSLANNFSSPTATSGGCGVNTKTTYRTRLTFAPTINPASDVLIALRIRPIYSAAQIAVLPAAVLPVQGNQITSVGTTESGINRKIVVFQSYKSPGTLFDAGVFSEKSFAR
jgi:Tfp pilus assembly protein PilX